MDAARPSTALTLAFVAIVLAVHALLVAGVARAGKAIHEDSERTARWMLACGLAAGAWLVFTAYLAARGFLLDFASAPPPFLVLMVPTVATTVVLAFSRLGTRLVRGLSWAAVVGFQAFRVPVELVLFALYRQGVIPVQMTFEGRNLDVLAGLSAAVIGVAARRRRLPWWLLLPWNLACLGLLANIVVVAVLSAPFPFRAFPEPPANTIVMHAPWVWLPAFLVQAALFGHLIALRKLAREPQAGREVQSLRSSP
jgi:hypothetical protein